MKNVTSWISLGYSTRYRSRKRIDIDWWEEKTTETVRGDKDNSFIEDSIKEIESLVGTIIGAYVDVRRKTRG